MSNKVRRIAAWTGIVILVGLYVAALVSALVATPASDKIFAAALYSTFVIPALIAVFEMIYRFTHRDNAVDKRDVNKMLKEADKDTVDKE